VQDQVGADHTGTHHPHDAQIGRVLRTTDPSQVSSGKCSPRTQKSDDYRLEIF